MSLKHPSLLKFLGGAWSQQPPLLIGPCNLVLYPVWRYYWSQCCARFQICSVVADFSGQPRHMCLMCSAHLVSMILPICPTYTLPHSHEMQHVPATLKPNICEYVGWPGADTLLFSTMCHTPNQALGDMILHTPCWRVGCLNTNLMLLTTWTETLPTKLLQSLLPCWLQHGALPQPVSPGGGKPISNIFRNPIISTYPKIRNCQV
jgi:hypothetical protein